MFSFANPGLLYLMFALLAVAGLFLWARYTR